MTLDTYDKFLKAKVAIAQQTGIDISPDEIHPALFPHQRDIVQWAVKGGRRAIFAAFGLGKTLMQLEICRLLLKYKGGKALIVCPLGVRQEFTRDAGILGMQTTFIQSGRELAMSYQQETMDDSPNVYLTNY